MPRGRDQRSEAAAQYRRFYNTATWKAARRAQLQRQPLCELCQERGRVTAANVVNHRKPHKGEWALFISPGNHQSVCKPCHDGAVQVYERTGVMPGWDKDGYPIDPGHPWNKQP